MSPYCPLSQAQQFFADTKTVYIDYSQGVFYTRWGTYIRTPAEEDVYAPADCTADPYGWNYELPTSDTMKIYTADVGDGNQGAVRIDFA